MGLFLVRYGEIGLKSPAVRRRFEHCLITNIEKAFIRDRAECKVTSDRGHLYVDAENGEIAGKVLAHTFGVTSYSKVDLIPSDMESICAYIGPWSKARLGNGQTFAIRARRVGRHGYSSRDVAVKAGDTVRLANEQKGVKVDLDHPDMEISIEVRDSKAYIYGDRVNGPGGMPLGSQGKVVAIVADEASALACWLIMKRGCHAVILPVGKAPPLDLLEPWAPSGELVLGPRLDEVREEDLNDVLGFAMKKRALALVLGNQGVLFKKSDFPIFYPIIGMSKAMIKDMIKRMRA
jgi:thiamine biosynthesis protein ThiI